MPKLHPIRQWLVANVTSQNGLCERAKIDPSSLSRFLSGERSLSLKSARKIRKITGLSLDELLCDQSPRRSGSRRTGARR